MKLGNIFKSLLFLALAVALAFFVYGRFSPETVSHMESEMQNPQETATPAVQSSATSESQPVQTPEPTLAPTPTPEPTPEPSPEPTPNPLAGKFDKDDWQLILVNTDHLLSGEYIPEVTALENGNYFDSRAVEALQNFIAAARNEGYTVYLRSSYRSYATQQSLFSKKISEMQSWYGYDYDTAYAKAAEIVAIPGTSEHQLGLSCDIVDQWYDYMNESLENAPLLIWMKEHCKEYGFILRYPKDKTEVTGIMFEPWHFRYVGVDAATYIMDNGLCLEEFWQQLEEAG